MADEVYSRIQLIEDAAEAARELFRNQAEDTPEESGEDITEALRYDGRDHEAADGAIPIYNWQLGELAADFIRNGAELYDPGLLEDKTDIISIIQVYAYEIAMESVSESLDELAAEWNAARDDAETPNNWQHWQGAMDELAEICNPAPQNAETLRQKLREAYPYTGEEIPPGMIDADIEDHHSAYLITFPDGSSVLLQGDDCATLDEEIRSTLGHTDPTDAHAVPVYYLYNADPSPEAEAKPE
jgi:hypothetical protein